MADVREGRLSTVDLFIKVACFVKKADNIFNIKSWSKPVSTRSSTVLSLCPQWGFPADVHMMEAISKNPFAV
jgi:hypothetical protein